MSYVAFQYAEALFSLAYEEHKVDLVYRDLSNFIDAIDTDIYTFLNHPKVTKNDKKQAIDQAISNSLVKHFIYVLIDKARIDLMEDCLHEFKTIIDNQNKVMNVVVYSGKELTKQELSSLTSNLEQKHNRSVELVNQVDPTIVGGIKVVYDGMVLDNTVNNYLKTLQSNLSK